MPEKGAPPATVGSCAPAAPRIAYVLLWFPLSSETFIFREIVNLRKMGLDISVYTMYGKSLKGCSATMLAYDGPVCRMGIAALPPIMGAFFGELGKRPKFVLRLMRKGLFRRMRNFESLCENVWCFLAGFLLARKCEAAGIGLIHSSWANGPATAAWIASSLSGIPFAFTGRAGDIYPEDGILAEKAAEALFIRTNNSANVDWLAKFCPSNKKDRIFLIYNSLTLTASPQDRERQPDCPFRILAVGRFARTKGFPELFTAMARLKREGFPARLTLVGDGSWRRRLLALRKRLGLEDCIDMPGFAPNDRLDAIMREHDVMVVPSVVHGNGDRDGIPNVIMEALSHGMPVVATDVCGIAEVIRDGETGLLVRQRDPRALAEAIRRVFADWPQALLMARRGRELVNEMFDPDRNTTALRDLYLKSACGDGNA